MKYDEAGERNCAKRPDTEDCGGIHREHRNAMDLMPVLVVSSIVCGVIGGYIGSTKGEAIYGVVLGILFGPLGILLAFVSRGNRTQCEACRSWLDPGASICPHCRSARTPGEPAPGNWRSVLIWTALGAIFLVVCICRGCYDASH